MKEYGPLMDCHVHIDEIKIHNKQIASYFGHEVGDVRWKGASTELHVKHIQKDNLEVIYAIYENPNSLTDLRSSIPSCDVRGMYFIRNVQNPETKLIRNLYKKGLIQGLKIHPVIDNFELKTENIKEILKLSREFKVPILYHSDDRNSYWHLTSPELQKNLIKENPDVTFIVGHGGAYAKPRLVGNNPSIKAYWEGNENVVSRKKLVTKALELTTFNDNAFYDMTIATNAFKAKIIADFVNKHSGSEQKILVGTDFPIGLARATSQLNALAKAGMKPSLVQKVAENRL
ncbi:MAG TPA: hypothetical protein VKC54_01810 [Patescibacteria group bacterium]|nr:hypothetical protein [Patescibacteria group bacterium]